MRKLKFYLLGLIPGLILVFFILNKKGATCTGYLPNSRVIAETLSKNFQFTPEFKTVMDTEKIDETFIKDSIITNGEINFDKSKAQQKPCPKYVLFYPKENPKYEVDFEKCDDKATFTNLKKLK
ncbi:hypothetical protein [uncultured Chryseobacterium sp.]|uniref:hypothetical protein n=1 Tax=uncultured Chryseobacterium sp. TaxID=259322 RepID=UPI0026392799|nr:hypothetical protein [uncultured Chryseobacterium sp.]